MKCMIQRLLVVILLGFVVAGCGGGKRKKGPAGPTYGPIEAALYQAAQTHRVPHRLILAVAIKESGLSPQRSSTRYDLSQNAVGFEIGESAFGLSLETLQLPDDGSAEDLAVQFDAYAKWIRANLDAKHLDLSPTIGQADQLYDWIWQLALLHREGSENRKNVQILFALELIEILNQGAIWQSAETDEMISLAPQNPPVAISQFSSPVQKNLSLDTQKSEIFSVDYMQVTYEQISGPQNQPKYILVVHCPFSLSACLELQNKNPDDSGGQIQAHYVIPSTLSYLPTPIKIRQHRSPVLLTNDQGQTQQIQDAVVIMLIGDSGRYIDGQRSQVNPSWYSSQQLENLGKMIRGICELMRLDDAAIDLKQCQTPGGVQGVRFQHQGSSETYRWGDIPDYDESIFWTYVRNPDEIAGKVEFEFTSQDRIFLAGSPISFKLNFITGTAKIILEYLERCENNKLIWTTLETRFIRNTNQQPFQTVLYDQGPNDNGQHFFRALVFDQENTLMGWDISDFYLRSYEKEGQPAANLKACERLGT